MEAKNESECNSKKDQVSNDQLCVCKSRKSKRPTVMLQDMSDLLS